MDLRNNSKISLIVSFIGKQKKHFENNLHATRFLKFRIDDFKDTSTELREHLNTYTHKNGNTTLTVRVSVATFNDSIVATQKSFPITLIPKTTQQGAKFAKLDYNTVTLLCNEQSQLAAASDYITSSPDDPPETTDDDLDDE